jgi:four helix bundle protein
MNQYTIELQSRSKQLAINIINLIKTLRVELLNKNIISQILRSSTSIGANYNEALECESRDDFVHKLSICKKEASETIYWLQLLTEATPEFKHELSNLIQESFELVKIFAASIATAKRNSPKN